MAKNDASHSLLKKTLFAIAPALVIYIGFEMGLRVSDWPQATAKFEHREPFWQVDPNLEDKVYPHKEEGTSFNVSTNDDGLRTEARTDDKGHKILSMGCSTTFGWGVEDKEAYPEVLDALITENGHAGISVINGGQPGYTSFQGNWLWQNTLKDYSPDVVLLGFVVQDARKAAYTDKSQAILQQDNRFFKDHLLYRSRVYLWLKSKLGQVQIRSKERTQDQESGIHRVPPEEYVENIRSLVSSIQSLGATPVLFGYPLEVSGYTKEHRLILKAASEELGLPYFDPQPKMETVSREAKSKGEFYYFKRDPGHANAKGNALIANWVYQFLVDENLLGGDRPSLR